MNPCYTTHMAAKMYQISLTSFVILNHTAYVILIHFLAVFAQGQGPGTINMTVVEESPIGTVVGEVGATPSYNYSFQDQTNLFQMSLTGTVRTTVVIDRDVLSNPVFRLLASGRPNNSQDKAFTFIVVITVLDINDNSPKFDSQSGNQNISFQEDIQEGRKSILTATDPDAGENGTITYSIVSGNAAGLFRLDFSGLPSILYIAKNGTENFDREKLDHYELNISAKDGGKPPRYGYTTIYVEILDVNDNTPAFDLSQYKTQVNENAPVGTSVFRAEATDPDLGLNGQIVYWLEDDTKQFTIDQNTGVIRTVSSPLKCTMKCTRSTDPCNPNSCFVVIEATDMGLIPLTGRAYLYIEVLDENDHDPVIRFFKEGGDSEISIVNVDENAKVNDVVFTISVSDADSGRNSETNLTIIHGNEGGYFSFIPLTGYGITLIAKALDRETIDRFNITFKAVDNGIIPRSSTSSIIIIVNDANDHSPEFEYQNYKASISEYARPFSYVASIRASDKDEGINAELTYEIASGNEPLGWFSIDSTTGLVTTVSAIDHEESVQVTLNISCHDSGSEPKFNFTTLVIDIMDENDYIPRFTQTNFKTELKENLPPNIEVITVKANDLDSGVNGTVEYFIHRDTQNRYPNYFSVQPTGKVMALKSFDREQKDQYIIKILASDKGPVPLSSTATIEVTIKDVNDNRPKFSPKDYYINVFDNDPAGLQITRVFAFDNDMGDYAKVTYTMVDSFNSFKINPDSGVISTSRVLNKQPYKITITAKDGGDLTSETDAIVNVIVINVLSIAPNFNSNSYSFTVQEDNGEQMPQIGRTIGSVGAVSTSGRTITYAITGGDPLGVFTIGSSSGIITTLLALDREERLDYNLTVIACDNDKISSRKVSITVTDLNDNAPIFVTETTEATVMENWPVGQNVFFAQAMDKDAGNNMVLSYTLTSTEDTNQVFSINSSTGIIYLAKPSNHMPKTSVTLTVTATDAGSVHKSSSMSVVVTVVDVNNHTPLFPDNSIELFLPESQPVNNVVKVLSATDGDKGQNAALSYSIVRGNEDRKFGIFPDGSFYVAHNLDRESKAMYSLMVVVQDNGEVPRSSAVNITVYVEDVNDNKPQFPKDVFDFYILENQIAKTYLGTVKADDLDIGRNAEILYSLADINVNFTIDPVLGNVYSKISFDREYLMKTTNLSYYVFDIYATDNGIPKLQTKASVRVHVQDVNDNPPVFVQASDSTIGVSENSNVNDVIYTLLAVDADEGANAVVSYTIIKGNDAGKFGINAATGQLFLKAALDREQVDQYKLTVKATDTGAPKQLESTTVLNINVLDYNDNAPEFANDTLSSISISETTSIGEVLTTFSGTDKDMGISATIRYDIVSGNYDDALSLGIYSGKLTLVRSLDYESPTHGEHSLNITLSDLGFPSLSVARMFAVHVIDANDNAPTFTDGFTQFYFNETVPVNTRIAAVSAVDKDSGDYGRVLYSLYKQSPSGYYFTINASTGDITLSRPLDRETYQSFKLTIQAIDQDKVIANRKTAEKSLTIIVQDANDNAPLFQSTSVFMVPFSSSSGNTIASVTATDQDSGDNGKVTYNFAGPKQVLFGINQQTGTISLNSTLPQSPQVYSLLVVATDGGVNDALGPKSSTVSVTLLVYTSNSNGPRFLSSTPTSGTVLENSGVGATVMRVVAESSQGQAVSYYIGRVSASGIDQGGLFTIGRSSGVITTALDINREALRSDTLTVDIIAAEIFNNEQRVTTQQVTIRVDDVNDNPPEFSSTLFDTSVSENLALGSSVMQVTVSDPDITGTLTLTLSGPDASKFRIVQNGTIYLTQTLDYETARVHDLNVSASDGALRSSALVRIYVIDENDNVPVFQRNFYSFDIPESSEAGYTVGRVSATDLDSGNNGLVLYEVTSQWGLDYFRLDSTRGTFTLIKPVDFEERQLYTMKLIARDQGSQPRSSEVTVYMNVKDVNDNQPTFDPMSYYREISEDAQVLTPVVNVSATDVDSGLSGVVRYSLVGSSSSKFAIGPINGSIYTVAGLDREQVPLYNLIVMATDQAPNPKDRLSTTATVQVKLRDVNDNSPLFISPEMIEVREDAKLNSSIFTVQVQDLDEGTNSQITYRIVSQTTAGTFIINAQTGALSLKSALDRETIANHSVLIEAKDGGTPSRSSQQTLVVQVTDANDNAPIFTNAEYRKTVDEDVAVGTSVLRVLATDKDIGFNGAVRYFIVSGEGSNDFNLDMTSGVLRVQKMLDYERITSYKITIQAEDSSVESRLQANATIIITLNDVNDFVPVFDDSPYVTFVQEGMPDGLVPILTISARDEDSGYNGMVSYTMRDIAETSYSGIFDVNATSGQVFVKRTLDREATPMYILTIVAMDSGAPVQIGTATVTVFVKDVNDHSPVFDSNGPYLANVMENLAAETPVIIVSATDSDEGMNSQIIYNLADNMGSKFTIHPSTAQISTAVSLDREVDFMYTLTVIATDQGIPPRSASVQVIVMVGDDNDNAPEFDSSVYTSSMYDSSVTGDFVIGVTAVDQDLGKNGQVVYTLEGSNQALFRINSETGVVTLASPLPLSVTSFNFVVRASDLGKIPLNSSSSVTITVSKAPTTSKPRFNDSNTNLRIVENSVPGMSLTIVHATTATNNRITYYIVGGNVNNAFSINSDSGAITVSNNIDYEVIKSFDLWIEARDQGTTQLSSYQTLKIAVEDENDNPPVFSSSLYTASVSENCQVGTSVFTVTATDLDSNGKQGIVYSIKYGNENNTFQLDSLTGLLSTLNRVVDREKIAIYNLEIQAADVGAPPRTASTTVRVTIKDLNDNQPTFVGPRSVAVPEDLLVGSLVLQLSSVDQDIGENARASYKIDTSDFPFVVNASTGTITNSQPLDAETTERYTLLVSVTDGSFIQRTTITIRILDVNDNPPQFKSSVLVYEFTELQQPSTKVTQLTAQDLDKSSPNNLFFFSLRRPSSQFELNSETGEIIVLEMMRFYAGQSVVDTMNDHILDVLVSDLGTPSLSSEATVNIKVIDANDHSPVFDKDKYFTAVPNNLNLSQNVIQVTCSDTLDYGVNAMVKYSLTKGTGLPYFIINNSTGVISSKASLPSAGSSPLLTLTVTCYDLGVPSLSTTTDVQLYITAPNGNAPRFNNNPFQKQVKEDVTIGFVIDTITATDSDSGLNGEIEYWITGGNSDGMFAIEVDTGKLVVNQTLDFETRVSYTVNITARDKALYSKEVTRAYDIQLIDVNDNKPLFDSEYYDAYIQENSVQSTPVFRAVATDADGTAANRIINYAIVGDATSKNSFQINANTGDIITGSTSFDYETRTLYTLLVMAYNPDQGNGEASYLKSVTTIYVHITGENEDSPRFLVRSYNFSISESAEMGKSVGKVTAMDKDHGVDGIVYYYLEAQSNLKGFLIEPLTGILRVSSRPDFESSPTVFLSVIAKNWGSVRGNDTDTCLVSISVIDANDPPEFTKAIYYANITENSPPNTFVTNVMAVDYDIRADFKQFKYKIMSGNVPERFQISSTGRIETSGLGVLDRETTSKYTLVVGAEDLNDPTIIGTATVVIELLDVNDNGPRFNPETLRLNVSENETAGIEVAVLRDYTVDADLPPNQGPYRYKFTLGSWSDYFSFNELTGRIETTKVLNRDLTPQFVIPVVVSDGGTPTMTSTLTFTIIVTDINDAQPRPRPLTVLVNLLENQRLSGKIADVRPLDSDLSDPFRCRILSGDAANFVINNNNCDLEALQLTSADTYKLRVQGTDDKYPSVEYDVTVNVQLLTNDSLISSVVMELRNEKASTFLEKKYTLFKKAVEDVFGVYVTCRIYSVKESGSNLYVFMFANDNHNRLLSSSDMIRGLNSSKSIVETASSVSIQNVALVRCSSGSCKNGGVCSTVVVLQKEITVIDSPSWVMTSWSPDPAISCFCMPAFTGPLCEDSQKPCGSDYCNHGGTCNNNVCSCPNNWQGPFCQIDVDECSLAPECKNGATCHNIDGSYECICTPGYQGKFCDTPNFCASQPCSPHGTCEELIDTYHCRCNYGYHGPTCQLSSMSFGEGSYAVFPSVDNYHTFNISLYFATVSSNALLMFSPVSIGQLRQGFIAVEVVNSQVKVSFLLDPPTDAQDSAVITLSTTAIVNTGYWYRLEFTKVTWTANLIVQKCPDQTCDSCVDKRKECYNETNFALQNLQLTGQYISIGGIKNFKDITDQKGAVSTHDFVGCVHSVSINNLPFGGSPLVSGSDSGASMPIESLNVSSTCPRQQATSMCVNMDCHDGTCVDKWSEVTCKCSSKYMDDTCSSVRQPFTLGNNAKVKYTLHQSFVRDATLAALRARRRRAVAESTLVLRLRTVQNKGVVFSSSTDTSSCLLWFDEVGLHFLLKSPDAVSDPITLTDVSIGDGSWHNVTVSRFGTTYTLDFDEQKSQSKVFGETYDFDSLRLMEMAIGGSAVVPANQEIQGFQGCLSQFLINGELMQLNGTSDKYLITTEGGVDGTCLALCSNSPCGGNNKCTPDGEKFKCMYMAEESAGLETGIIVVIVFFSILLCAIVVVFVLFRTRRDLFHRCVRSKKKSPSIGSSSSHGKVLDNMITSGGINSRYALNPSEEEMIIRNHIAENLNGSKGSSLSARPDLIGSNFSDQPLHLSDGTVIMETGVMNNLLGEEDAPEHYDFENASSIAPSDIAPSEVIRHYKDFRNGTHHHHHHHQQLQPSPLNNQLFNKYRDSPVSGSNYRAGPNASHVRQSPLSLSGSALSVPHNGSQVLLPTGGRPSSALAALNQAEGSRSRMSPLTQLNVRSPRTLPQNYNTNNLSRSNSIGSHHSHSSSSSATGHLIPPVHSQHKLTNNKSLSLARGSNPKGLTVEDVNRLNARPDLTDPLSLLEVGSSSVDGRPKVNHHILPQEPVLDSSLLLEAPDSSSSDSGANDSFTCSEFEYDNDNVRTRLDLDPKKMIFSKLTEVENESDDHHHPPQHQKMNSDGFVSNGDSFTSTNPSSSSLGSPSTPNHQYLISNQYDFDALLNWAPNFDKFVGVFRDIAQLPDTGGHKNVTDHDYEEYV